MRALLLALALAGCGDNITTTRTAAEDLAAVTCARRIECGPDFDRTLEQCIAWTVDDLCKSVDCDAEYQRADELEACLASYDAATCDDAPTICGL